MILDNAGLLSDAQALDVAYNAAAESTNWIDFGVETDRNGITGTFYRDWAAGNPLYVNMLVTTSFAATGDAGIRMILYGAADGGTPAYDAVTSITLSAATEHVQIDATALAAGTKASFVLNPLAGGSQNILVNGMRYLRAAYIGTGTSGAVTGSVRMQLAACPETTTTGLVTLDKVGNVYPASHASAG